MSGHGSFSAIGSGMKVPQTFDLPQVEELQPGKDGGPKPKPLPAVGGRSPNDTMFAKNVQADVNDLQVPLFRRDLLPHIAKPGWFEE